MEIFKCISSHMEHTNGLVSIVRCDILNPEAETMTGFHGRARAAALPSTMTVLRVHISMIGARMPKIISYLEHIWTYLSI
jgi:hypothetical protein